MSWPAQNSRSRAEKQNACLNPARDNKGQRFAA